MRSPKSLRLLTTLAGLVALFSALSVTGNSSVRASGIDDLVNLPEQRSPTW
jgi:hypothetical protein